MHDPCTDDTDCNSGCGAESCKLNLFTNEKYCFNMDVAEESKD